MRSSLIRATLFCGWLACLLTARRAAATENEDPESLIERGNALRRKHEDIKAHGYFQRAYEIARTPRAAAQLGLADLSVSDFFAAEGHLSEALADVADPWVVAHRAVLENSLTTAREQLGSIAIVNAPPDTTVSFAGRAAMKLPPDGVIYVSPGEIAVRLSAPVRDSSSQTLTVTRGQRISLEANLPARPPGPAPVATTGNTATPETTGEPAATLTTSTTPPQNEGGNGRGGRIVGLALAGAGVALDVGGLVLRSMGGTKLNAIETMQNYDPSNGNWKTYDRAGVTLLVIGSAAIVSGAVVFLLNWHADGASRSGEAKTSFLVLPTDRGASLALGGRF